MKIIVLGSSAAFAGKNDGCSSYLISTHSSHFLVDTGPGCLSMLQNYIRYTDISAIFLSHLHADHVSDIYTLRYAVYVAQRDGYMRPPLPIYMPRSPGKSYRFIRTTIKKEFDIIPISEKKQVAMGDVEVTFKRTSHPVVTHAMKFQHQGKSLVYTADTGYFDQLAGFCRGADLLIADATLQNSDRQLEAMGHMTAETAGKLAKLSEAKKLVLAHIWPEYRKYRSLEEAGTVFDGDAELASRGLELTL
ncbi:MAG: MBL fold metallo-hydrolase [Spirochaetota bacterium]